MINALLLLIVYFLLHSYILLCTICTDPILGAGGLENKFCSCSCSCSCSLSLQRLEALPAVG